MSLAGQIVSEIVCRAVSVMQEAKQAVSGASRKDVTLEVNIIASPPVRERRTSGRHWKNKNPSSLLGHLRQAWLEPASTFLQHHIWTGRPGACPWNRPLPKLIKVMQGGRKSRTGSTPRGPTITAFSYVPFIYIYIVVYI